MNRIDWAHEKRYDWIGVFPDGMAMIYECDDGIFYWKVRLRSMFWVSGETRTIEEAKRQTEEAAFAEG